MSQILHLSGARAQDGLEYRMSLLPGLLPRDKHAGASLPERTLTDLVLISFCTGLTVDGAIFRTTQVRLPACAVSFGGKFNFSSILRSCPKKAPDSRKSLQVAIYEIFDGYLVAKSEFQGMICMISGEDPPRSRSFLIVCLLWVAPYRKGWVQ